MEKTQAEILDQRATIVVDNISIIICTDWAEGDIIFSDGMPPLYPATQVSDSDDEMRQCMSGYVLIPSELAEVTKAVIYNAVELHGTCPACEHMLARGWCENCTREPTVAKAVPAQPAGYVSPLIEGPLGRMIQVRQRGLYTHRRPGAMAILLLRAGSRR